MYRESSGGLFGGVCFLGSMPKSSACLTVISILVGSFGNFLRSHMPTVSMMAGPMMAGIMKRSGAHLSMLSIEWSAFIGSLFIGVEQSMSCAFFTSGFVNVARGVGARRGFASPCRVFAFRSGSQSVAADKFIQAASTKNTKH